MVASSSRRSSPSPVFLPLLRALFTAVFLSSIIILARPVDFLRLSFCFSFNSPLLYFSFFFSFLSCFLYYVHFVDELDTHMHVIARGRVMVDGRAGYRRRRQVE